MFRYAWLSIAVLALALVACEGPEARERHYMERGEELFEESKYTKAELEFKNVLQINPKNVEAIYYIGRVAEERGELKRAVKIFREVLEERPEHANANASLGRLSLGANDPQKALDYANAALEAEPQNVSAMATKAAVLTQRDKFDEAESLLKSALELDPAHSDSHSALVGLHLRRGERERAYQALEDALEQLPDSITLRLAKISLLAQDDMRREIVETFQQIFELTKKPAEYHFRLAQLHALWEQPDKAIEELRVALEADSKNEQIRNYLVDYTKHTQGVAAAEAELRRHMTAQEGSPENRFVLVDFYTRNQMLEKAVENLNVILAEETLADKWVVQANSRLASIALQRSDFEKAQEHANAALAVTPSDPDARRIRGAIHLRDKEYEAAIRDFREVLRNQPDSPVALRLISEAHEQSGELELATDYLVTLLGIDPADTGARLKLANLLHKQKLYDIALEHVDRVLERRPSTLSAIGLKSEILLAKGNYAQSEYLASQLRLDKTSLPLGERLLGEIALAQGDPEGAYEHFKTAYELRSDDFDLFRRLMMVQLKLEHFDEARKIVSEYIDRNADDARAYNILGEALQVAGDTEGAAKNFRKASEINPGWIIPRVNLARLYNSTGDHQTAEQILAQGLKESPSSASLYFFLGGHYERLGKFEAAANAYEQAYDLNSEHYLAANNAAAIYAEHYGDDPGKLERAQELVQGLRDREEALILDTVGWVDYQSGDYERAVSYLGRALQAAPQNQKIRLHLGLALYRTGRAAEAREHLEAVAASGSQLDEQEELVTVLSELRESRAQN